MMLLVLIRKLESMFTFTLKNAGTMLPNSIASQKWSLLRFFLIRREADYPIILENRYYSPFVLMGLNYERYYVDGGNVST